MNSLSTPVRWLLCLLLLLVVWLGASSWIKSWETSIRQEEQNRAAVAWGKKIRAVESDAQTELKEQRRLHEATVTNITTARDAALGELRSRPSRAAIAESQKRASASGQACPVAPACTGDRLASDDAEFLTRYAAGSALVASDGVAAREAYETCRLALERATNGLEEGHKGDRNGDQGNSP